MVEDDPGAGRVIRTLLEQAGHAVTLATTAAELLARVRDGSFDVILSDIHLPDDSQLGFLARLEASGLPRVPTILVTGAPTVDTAIQALRHGVVDYLRKPVQAGDLLASVTKAIGWRRALESVQSAQRDAEAWLRSLQAAGDVLRHGVPARPDEAARLPLVDVLSARERQIVQFLSSGRRVPEIASVLEISPNTVRNHLKSVFRKLGVSSQVELLSRLAGGGA